jgi:hypothetical protein
MLPVLCAYETQTINTREKYALIMFENGIGREYLDLRKRK